MKKEEFEKKGITIIIINNASPKVG